MEFLNRRQLIALFLIVLPIGLCFYWMYLYCARTTDHKSLSRWFELAALMVLPFLLSYAVLLLTRLGVAQLTSSLLFLILLLSVQIAATDNLKSVQITHNAFPIACGGFVGSYIALRFASVFSAKWFGFNSNKEKKENRVKVFSLSGVMCWTCLTAIALALVIENEWNSVVARIEFGVGLAGVAALYGASAFLVILPLLFWLHSIKPLFAGIVSSLVGFVACVVLCGRIPQSWRVYELQTSEAILVVLIGPVLVCSVGTMVYASKLLRPALDEPTPLGALRKWSSRIAVATTGATLVYAACWCVMHNGIWFGGPTTAQERLNSTEAYKNALTGHFPEDIFQQAKSQGECDLVEFGHRLMLHDVKPEDNAARFLIQTLGSYEYEEEDENARLLKWLAMEKLPQPIVNPLHDLLMQKREDPWELQEKEFEFDFELSDRELVASFSKHGSNLDVLYMAACVPWSGDNFPQLNECIESTQPVFGAIRNASKCKHFYYPSNSPLEGQYLLERASRLLLQDAHYQLGKNSPSRALEDLSAIFRLLKLNAQMGVRSDFHFVNSISRYWLRLAIHIAQHPSSSHEIRKKVLKMTNDLPSLNRRHDEHLSDLLYSLTMNFYPLEQNLLFESPLVDSFALRYPRAVDWEHCAQLHLTELKKRLEVRQATIETCGQDLIGETSRSHGFSNRIFAMELLALVGTPKMKAEFVSRYAKELEQMGQQDALAYLRWTNQRRQKATFLAIKVFYAEKNRYPNSLAELDGLIDMRLTKDIYSGKPFFYQRTDTTENKQAGFDLYSFGRNLIDEDGADASGDYRFEPIDSVAEYIRCMVD